MREESEMTIKGRMDHETIFDVACFIKPIYDLQQARYIEMIKSSVWDDAAQRCIANPDKELAWNESVIAYHRVLMRHASKLGKATTIGSAAIKMLMGVRGTIIVWTPEWLRNVANYEKINPNYWVHPQAQKLNQYEFPQEISS
jgi:hypothetical protein